MLSVDLNCEQHMLGKVYAVLSKRRALWSSFGLELGGSTRWRSGFGVTCLVEKWVTDRKPS